MTIDLFNQLKEKYSNLLKEVKVIECEDGWYNVLDTLCGKIQKYINDNEEPQTRFLKIKKLYGTLSIDAFTNGDGSIDDMIEEAEEQSLSVCEFTGKKGEMHCRGSLYQVLSSSKAAEMKMTPVN